MKLLPRSLVLASLLLTAVALPAPSLFAADAAASPAAVKKGSKFPFHGKVKSVDVSGMTFTLDGATPRVFSVTATTKIKKNGVAATLSDAVVGDDVGGLTQKDADGKLTALSVRFGPRPGSKAAAASSTTPAPAAPAATQPAAAASATPDSATAAASATPKAKHVKKAKKSKASPSPSAAPSA